MLAAQSRFEREVLLRVDKFVDPIDCESTGLHLTSATFQISRQRLCDFIGVDELTWRLKLFVYGGFAGAIWPR